MTCFRIRSACVSSILLISAINALGYAQETSLELLQSRLRTDVLGDAPSTSETQSLERSVQQDGTWLDIDYRDRTRGGWSVAEHVYRIRTLARAYEHPDSKLRGSQSLREAMLRSLDHWLEEDYRCPNWWYNEIGVPRVMADITLLIEKELSFVQREGALAIIRRATFGQTGQNSVWRAGITFKRALIEDDFPLAKKARDIILQDLVVTTAEGVQPDFSFHQHGPQQQFGNYGLAFAGDMTRWGLLWKDTPLELSEEQLDVLRRYIIDGLSWVVHKGMMDVSSCGRQLFPNAQRSKAQSFFAVCERMAKLDPSLAPLLVSYDEGVWGSYVPKTSRIAGRYFWRSDYAIHRSGDWMVSVKMNSRRTIGCETCNSENMQGYYLADGSTYVYRDGREYEDIYPVWNWNRLPGVTCQASDGLAPVPNTRDRNDSDFVGGVALDPGDGPGFAATAPIGVAAMDYNRRGVQARKAWFFIEDTIVCLGAGIASDTDKPIWTSVDQCLARGDATVSVDGEEANARGESIAMRAGDWAHHDGTGYVMLGDAEVIVQTAPQTGTWKSVRRSMSDRSVTEDVFSMWIDHGETPQGATYAYAVLPDVELAEMPEATGELPFEIIANTPSIQAVALKGRTQVLVAFYEAGDVPYKKHRIVAKQPCLIEVQFDGNDASPVDFICCDPTQKLEKLEFEIDAKSIEIELAPGALAGSGYLHR